MLSLQVAIKIPEAKLGVMAHVSGECLLLTGKTQEQLLMNRGSSPGPARLPGQHIQVLSVFEKLSWASSAGFLSDGMKLPRLQQDQCDTSKGLGAVLCPRCHSEACMESQELTPRRWAYGGWGHNLNSPLSLEDTKAIFPLKHPLYLGRKLTSHRTLAASDREPNGLRHP